MTTTRILIQKAFVHLVIPTAAKQVRVYDQRARRPQGPCA